MKSPDCFPRFDACLSFLFSFLFVSCLSNNNREKMKNEKIYIYNFSKLERVVVRQSVMSWAVSDSRESMAMHHNIYIAMAIFS